MLPLVSIRESKGRVGKERLAIKLTFENSFLSTATD
jgi:hypothetical protein